MSYAHYNSPDLPKSHDFMRAQTQYKYECDAIQVDRAYNVTLTFRCRQNHDLAIFGARLDVNKQTDQWINRARHLHVVESLSLHVRTIINNLREMSTRSWILVVKKVSATLEKMHPCHSLRFAGGATKPEASPCQVWLLFDTGCQRRPHPRINLESSTV